MKLSHVSTGLCELHFTSRLQIEDWRTLAEVCEVRHRSSRCHGLRVLEHDWQASIDGKSLARIMKVCWAALECLGSPMNPWTGKVSKIVGDAVFGLEALCLQNVYYRGMDGGYDTRNAFIPIAYTLGIRAPQLRPSTYDISLHDIPFALMCQGLNNGNWYGLTKLELVNCQLTVEDLKRFTSTLQSMENAVFHRLFTIDLSQNPLLGAHGGSFFAGALCRPTMFPRLKDVVLYGCTIGDVGLSIILHSLASWPTCTPYESLALSVGACRITDRGVMLLVEYLRQHRFPLRFLSAGDNPGITDVGGLALIEAVSMEDSPVVSLELGGIGMTQQAVLEAVARTGRKGGRVTATCGGWGSYDINNLIRRYLNERRRLQSFLLNR